MNKILLYENVKSEILRTRHKHDFDIPLVLYLIEKTIFNDPTKNCIVKGHRSDWVGLPPSKSLFHAAPNCGLPIGNLTSQLFGNVYLNEFDHWIKKQFNIKYYGRYVDDFVIVHPDKTFLAGLIPQIAEFLQTNLQLTLHPNKIYLQHHSKGLQYLGAIIKPWRIYIANRTKGNFYQAIQQQNQIIRKHTPCPITGIHPPQEEKDQFLCIMNSYLGILNPGSKNAKGNGLYKTYRLRRKMINRHLSGWWCNLMDVQGYGKVGLSRKLEIAPQVSSSCRGRNFQLPEELEASGGNICTPFANRYS